MRTARRIRSALGPILRGMRPRSVPRLVIRMPGTCFDGPLPLPDMLELGLAIELRAIVEELAGNIGERNVFHPKLLAAAELYIGTALASLGYRVRRQTYEVRGVTCANLDVEIQGTDRPDEIVVIGAHYDAVQGSPAANDNGSGVAATLALARLFAESRPSRTVRFAFFANEEPPFF